MVNMAELKDQIMDDVTAPHDQGAGEAESENQTNFSIASEPNRLGFFSLPPELRLIVYREMLLETKICDMWWHFSPKPPLLETCRLIYYEAFEVLYGQNTFRYYFDPLVHPPPVPFRLRIVDTIERLVFDSVLDLTRLADGVGEEKLKELIREFGNPARIRQYLQMNLEYYEINLPFLGMDPFPVEEFVSDEEPLGRYLNGVGTFTNFKTVEVDVVYKDRRNDNPLLIQRIAKALQPRFGTSRLCGASGRVLQFHPHDHLISQRAQNFVD